MKRVSKKICTKFFSTSSKSLNNATKGIYFDFQATSPLDPRVLDKMLPYMTEEHGNPHSITHSFGTAIMDEVEIARSHIKNLINCKEDDYVVFTSGATESNNISLKGVMKEKEHLITTQIEHKCILETAKYLKKKRNCEVTFLPVDPFGMISLDELKKSIKSNTKLVSVMTVNNEIGVLQQVKQIGEICNENGVLFHTDVAQALGKIKIDVEDSKIDLMSASSHKLYGPKGVGMLFMKKKKPRIKLEPLFNGGGQEFGIRSGTLPSYLCIGFGEACRIAKEEFTRDEKHVKELTDRFLEIILNGLDYVHINGSMESRYMGNINLSFEFVEGESIMLALNDIAVSSGSACTSESLETSYVLDSLGIGHLANNSIRFGIGRFTTMEEIEYVAGRIVNEIKKLREMSPLYDLAKKGIDINTIEWSHSH